MTENERIWGSKLKDGDIVLCKSNTVVGRLIGLWTRSPYVHCGMVWLGGGVPFVMEFNASSGGRCVPLRNVFKEYGDGMIDVYRCDRLDTVKACEVMERTLSAPYSRCTILRNIFERFFTTRRTFDDADSLDLDHGLTCATAVAYAMEQAGVDPCPNLRTASVTPGDLGRSSALKLVYVVENEVPPSFTTKKQ